MSVVMVTHEPDPALAEVIAGLNNQDYLVVNTDDRTVIPFLASSKNAAKVITYGFNAKACITASSISDENVQVCIQRGFTGAGGQVYEPQEFSASIPFGADAADVLAASAYALVSAL